MNSIIGVLFLVSAVVGQGSIDAATLALIDKNSDGILERSELPGMADLDDATWAPMMNLMDTNHDGKLSISEYVDFANDQHAAQGNPTKQMEQGMHALDLNNDGILDRDEVPGYSDIPNDAWKQTVRNADYNCDARISIDEFIAMRNRQSQGGRHEPPNCQRVVQGDTVLPECHNSTQGLAQMDRSTAERAVRAAIAKSEELDVAVTIAVVDSGANLVSLVRMDGAWLGSVDIAIKKAKTAAMFNMPTRDLEGMSQPGGPLYNVENANDGGIPVRSREGRLLGAVGVAGSTEVYKDEEVVEAAVNASA